MAGANTMRKGYHNLLRREILELVPTSAKRILDLGCGTGELGKALKKRQECRAFGLELNREAGKIAQKNLDGVWIDNLNRFDPSLSNVKYDCLVFADILEHLIAPWKVLKKFTNVLTDGGCVIASIPNVAHPWIQANLKKGLFRYEPAGILDITHLRFFTKTSIFQMFYTAGLKVVNIRPYPSDKNPLQYHVTAVKALVEHKKPVATILILTHNGWAYTKKCIDSIKRNTRAPYKILVIDNNSTDETVKELRKDWTLYHIENSYNLGFSAGFNLGLMLIDTPYFVIANNDVVTTEYWLGRMINHIVLDKDLMILGPRSNYVSGPQIIKNIPYTDDKSLETFARKLFITDTHAITYFQRIVFFFTLFKSEVLQRIGYLDEIYEQGNFEDDDYCMRVAAKKLKAAYDNTVFIHHYGSQSFKKDPAAFHEILHTNKKKFFEKWHLTQYYGQTLDVTQ